MRELERCFNAGIRAVTGGVADLARRAVSEDHAMRSRDAWDCDVATCGSFDKLPGSA